MARAAGPLLVALVMVTTLAGAAEFAVDTPYAATGTPDDLCELLPPGAESVEPWTSEGVRACIGRYGPDGIIVVDVFELSSDVEAQRLLGSMADEFRAGQWPRSSVESGDVGYEFDGTGFDWDPVPDFQLAFVRGPYYVVVHTVVGLGGSKTAVRDLATEVDRSVEAQLGGANDSGTGADTGASGGTSVDDAIAAIEGMIFGTTGNEEAAIRDAMIQFVDCSDIPDLAERTLASVTKCKSVVDAADRATEVHTAFMTMFPEASGLLDEFRATLGSATFLAGLTAIDGQPLFPSVLGAFDLFKRLLDGPKNIYSLPGQERMPAARRFLEMLMALDARNWEARFGL